MSQQKPYRHNETNIGPKPLTRRSFLKKAALWSAGLILTPSATAGYARWIEPHWLETVHIDVTLPRLPQALAGLRIAHFSDLHLGFHFAAKDLPPLVAAVNALQPDMVCFTGDLVDYSIPQSEAVSAVIALSQLSAPFGKFGVLGNHDYYSGQTNQLVGYAEHAGFRMLRNEAVRLELNGEPWWIAGVEDQFAGEPDLAKALRGVPGQEWTMLLSHCPDYADTALRQSVDLQLSGHSHGGQVRIPGYGAVFTPRHGSKYVDGLYSLGEGKLQVYVNRGIGVSTLPFRFACRPELTLLTLRRP